MTTVVSISPWCDIGSALLYLPSIKSVVQSMPTIRLTITHADGSITFVPYGTELKMREEYHALVDAVQQYYWKHGDIEEESSGGGVRRDEIDTKVTSYPTRAP